MNMGGSKGRMVGLTREITVQWDEVRNYWRDAKSEEFDKRFMNELNYQVSRAITVVEQLDELLKKVRSDCE
jgi:hypothetical protein